MAFKITSKRYIQICKKTLDRATRYENKFPKNCGYYDGTYLWGDCWCFNPKTVIWGEAAGTPVCDNYTPGTYVDVSTGISRSGLPDTTGDAIMNNYCTPVTFVKMLQTKKAPCLLLINGQHMGAYIGDYIRNGKIYNTCEYTSNPKLGNGLCPSYVDESGARRTHKGGTIIGYWNRAGYLTSFVDYNDSTINKLNTKDLANAIIQGVVHNKKIGNGQTRINNLKSLGYTEEEIKKAQELVNQLLSSNTTITKLTPQELATAIMTTGKVEGKLIGNGQERINNLKALGYTEEEIKETQNIINQMFTNPIKTQKINHKENIIKKLPIIKNGSQGQIVTILQKTLKNLGFYSASIDGRSGPATVDAIKAAQKSWGLGQDGIFGPKSWSKLLEG